MTTDFLKKEIEEVEKGCGIRGVKGNRNGWRCGGGSGKIKHFCSICRTKLQTLKLAQEKHRNIYMDKIKQVEELEKDYIEIPELGIKITPKQLFNGEAYEEIIKKVLEDNIATYEILQKLRNIAFESGWKKYPFMKDFWVFVPNPDEAGKSECSVAGFYAGSGRASLSCGRIPSFWNSNLGVFLYCPITSKTHKRKSGDKKPTKKRLGGQK